MQSTHILPLIEVSGSHREMGRQFGEQLRESVNEYAEMWLATAARRSGLDRDALLAPMPAFVRVIEEFAPHLAEEVRGVADGAGIPEMVAFSIQIRMELLYAGPPPQSCTTFALTGERTASGQTIVGQNVDLDEGVERFGVILKMKPEDAPSVMMYTSPGLVSYVGMNDAGLAVHGNLLLSPGWRPGFPRYLITRLMLEHPRVDDALEAGLQPPRASSRNLILGDAKGTIANVELTVDDARVLRSDQGELLHTNHYLAADFCEIGEGSRPPGSSHHRLDRIHELMSASDEPLSVDDLKGFFRDHDGYPGSICAHVRENNTSKTVASLISEPAAGRMHVAPGSPCESEYTVYQF